MINAQMLKLKGACAAQVELFEVLFPDGADLTVENALSVAHRFEWDWAAQKLFLPENRDAYNAAVKAARDALDAAVKPARGAYDAVVNYARSAYNAVEKPALDACGAYNAVVRSARDARDVYDVARARAFAEIYIKQEHTK